jgi:hypothetical protein
VYTVASAGAIDAMEMMQANAMANLGFRVKMISPFLLFFCCFVAVLLLFCGLHV